MADPRFFKPGGPFTLAQLAEIAGAELQAGADESRRFSDLGPLESAGPDTVSFLDNKLYVEAFTKSEAGACLVHPDYAERAPVGMSLLLCETPYMSYARVANAFYPEPEIAAGVHDRAMIDPSARLGDGVRIAAGAVIGADAEIGNGCDIGANVVIDDGVAVGADTRIGVNASLSHCYVGARCLIHPGVRIGQRGFGFAMDAAGHVKVPQIGRVIIHDDVEIGANSTIDRGTGPDTVIGSGCMIDNLVQIGHNVQMGRGCVVVAQAGVAGSTRLGDNVILAAQAGLVGHLKIGDGAQIAAQSGVMRDVPAGAKVCGAPAIPVREFFRQTAALARLAQDKKGRNEDTSVNKSK